MDTQSHAAADPRSPFGETFTTGYELRTHDVVDPWWMYSASVRGYSEFTYATRNTKLDPLEPTTLEGLLPEGARIVRRSFLTRMGKQEAVVELEDSLAALALEQWHVWVAVAANDAKQADYVKDLLIGSFPENDLEGPETSPFVPLTVWTGVRSATDAARMGRLEVHPWSGIAANYAPETGAGLLRLFEGFAPGVGGKLLLWHGVPGTGKSHALGALAHAWRSWCTVHYVADPEDFLGDSDYLLAVLMQRPRAGKDWKLVILEDTGELLTADAHQHTGQALSRLLNVTDGMLGAELEHAVPHHHERARLELPRGGRQAGQVRLARGVPPAPGRAGLGVAPGAGRRRARGRPDDPR